MVKHADLYYDRTIANVLRYQAQTMKDVLAKQVRKREVLVTVLSDTAVAITGEAWASMGPYVYPPPPSEPAGDDPDLFRGKLIAQVDDVRDSAIMFLSKIIDDIQNLLENIDDPNTNSDVWDKYDDTKAQKAYQDFLEQADGLAGTALLPTEEKMADELEKFIWALWIPSLYHVDRHRVKRTYHGEPLDYEVENEVYVPVRKPVNDRLVALGFETDDETDYNREKEDKLLIKRAEDYLRYEMKPWVSGKSR